MRITAKDNLIAWRLLVDLASSGNLTCSSIELNLDLSVASKLIRDLEVDLGVKLVDRSRRPMVLTSAAQTLLPRMQRLIADHSRLCEGLNNLRPDHAQKTIRLGVSLNRTRKDVLQIIREYRERVAYVNVEIVTGSNQLDVLEGRVDAACVAWRPSKTSGLRVLDMGSCPNFMMASPSYLSRYGRPRTIQDLSGHRLLVRKERFYPVADMLYNEDETFDLCTQRHEKTKNGMLQVLSPSENERRAPIEIVYGDTVSCKVEALEGMGIAVDLSCGLMADDLLSGRLVPVLPQWHRARWNKTIVVGQAQYDDEDVRTFVHWFLQREIKASYSRWSRVFDALAIERPW